MKGLNLPKYGLLSKRQPFGIYDYIIYERGLRGCLMERTGSGHMYVQPGNNGRAGLHWIVRRIFAVT